MKSYFRRLASHPGVSWATMFTLMLMAAGASNESLSIGEGMLFGLGVSVVFFWLPVLISNRQ